MLQCFLQSPVLDVMFWNARQDDPQAQSPLGCSTVTLRLLESLFWGWLSRFNAAITASNSWLAWKRSVTSEKH